MSKKLVSVVVPVFNEEENVARLHAAVTETMAPLGERYDWEFVFTDNHSSDRTFELLEGLAKQDPRVRAFRFSRNFGFQRSIWTGYALARGDAAVQLDCDLQDPPGLIPEFLRLWEQGYKVVYGIRRSRPEGWWINLYRKVFYRLIDFLSEDDLPKDAGDFRLVDRRVLDELRLIHDQQPYLRGSIAALGFRQIGVPSGPGGTRVRLQQVLVCGAHALGAGRDPQPFYGAAAPRHIHRVGYFSSDDSWAHRLHHREIPARPGVAGRFRDDDCHRVDNVELERLVSGHHRRIPGPHLQSGQNSVDHSHRTGNRCVLGGRAGRAQSRPSAGRRGVQNGIPEERIHKVAQRRHREATVIARVFQTSCLPPRLFGYSMQSRGASTTPGLGVSITGEHAD